VPANLGGLVIAVLGLQSAYHPQLLQQSTPQPVVPVQDAVNCAIDGPGIVAVAIPPLPLNCFNWAQTQKIYNAAGVGDAGSSGAAPVNIGIFTTNHLKPVLDDFDAAYHGSSQFTGPNAPKLGISWAPPRLIPVYSDANFANYADDATALGEFDMDTQTSTGLAATAVSNLVIFNASALADTAGLFTEFANFVSMTGVDANGKPVFGGNAPPFVTAASGSFGGCDALWALDGEMVTADNHFLQGAAQGQTVFFSTGDVGAACSGPVNGVPDEGVVGGAEYPASSPWAIAVGGTTLFAQDDPNDPSLYDYDFEITWEATGGGVSFFEPVQPWQAPFLVPALPSQVGGGRGLPDISMDADLGFSGIEYVSGSALSEGGGTSLSSPLALGAWARIVSAHGINPATGAHVLGFAAPSLYALGTPANPAAQQLGSVAGFHDIIIGNNGLYSATPGYDYTTGLGSFDIAAVNALISPVPFTGGGITVLPSRTDACLVNGGYKVAGAGALSSGQNTPLDVKAVYIAEPFEAAHTADGGRIRISLDLGSMGPSVGGSPTFVPNASYYVYFTMGDGQNHFVGYNVTQQAITLPLFGTLGGGSKFFYGHQFVSNGGNTLDIITDGDADADSYIDTAHNRIVWLVKKRSVFQVDVNGNPTNTTLANLQKLTAVYGESDETVGVDGAGLVNPLIDTLQGTYEENGNTFCSQAPKVALSADHTTVTPPAAVTFTATPDFAFPADPGASIVGYTFDPGDGSTPMTTSVSPTTGAISFAYAYASVAATTVRHATVTLTDSNGHRSGLAIANITVLGGGSGGGTNVAPAWTSQSPANGTRYDLSALVPFSVALQASDANGGDVVHIGAVTLPAGASLASSPGNPASATFSWTPTIAGDYVVQFTATDSRSPALSAAARSIVLHVASRATSISAKPAILDESAATVRLKMKAVLTATSPSQAISGKVLTFTAPNGAFLCQAVTDGTGTATCGAPDTYVRTAVNRGYVAKFTGDSAFAAASGSGLLIH